MEEKMSDMHEPDSRFVERLGWQLSTEYRRADRFKAPAGKIAVPRTVVALSLLAGILMTGVATIKAADYIKDSWQKKIEIARAETEVTLNQAHLESFSEMASQAEARYSDGLIREEEYLVVKVAADRAELALQRSRMDLDEVTMSGVIPRDELYAPVIGGRDFVSERLQIEKKRVELELEPLIRRLDRFEQLVENGLVTGNEMGPVQTEIADRNKIIDRIENQLELRKRFVAGELTAREVEIAGRISSAASNLRMAESRVDSLQTELNRLKALADRGLVNQTEVSQCQYTLDAALAELKFASLEIDVLENIK
jgi:multidrug resistance efflux pump